MAQCPYCHKNIALIPAGFAGQSDRYQTLESAAFNPLAISPAIPQGSDWQKITPIGRLEPRDITTAVYDAAISFGLVTSAAAAAAYAMGWPWYIAPTGGLIIAIIRYFGGLRLARSLLEVVETLTNTDLDHDGKVGKQQIEIKAVVENNGKWQFADLPGEPAALVKLASSDKFTERTAVEAGLPQDKFGELRDKFIDRGWAVWNHPTQRQQGVTLTVSGKAILRAIAAAPLP